MTIYIQIINVSIASTDYSSPPQPMRQTMRSFSTFDDDDSGPEPFMRALEATPCRRALVANAGHIGLSPELISYHKREAERLRRAAFRQAGRKVVATVVRFIRTAH
jgi:hypothetical protein